MGLPTEPIIDQAKAARLKAAAANGGQRQADGEKAQQDRRREAAVKQLKDDLGCRYWPDEVGIERFQVYATEQKAVLDRLRGLAGHLPEQIRQGVGLFLYGPSGTGKEHLLASMLYVAAEAGIACRWQRGLDIYGHLRDRMSDGAKEEEFLRLLTAPTVLAISDPIPPIGDLSAFRTEFLMRLVDRRYNARKPTWVTVNVADLDDADYRLSSPVFDRLQQDAEIFHCKWQSFRELQRKQRQREAS